MLSESRYVCAGAGATPVPDRATVAICVPLRLVVTVTVPLKIATEFGWKVT